MGLLVDFAKMLYNGVAHMLASCVKSSVEDEDFNYSDTLCVMNLLERI